MVNGIQFLLGIGFIVKHIDVFQIAGFAVKVKSEANDESRGDGEADIVRLDVSLEAFRLEKESSDFNVGGVHAAQVSKEFLHGSSGVNNVFNDDNRSALDGVSQPDNLSDLARRLRSGIGAEAHKCDFGIAVKRAEKVGRKGERPVKHTDNQGIPAAVFPGDVGGYFFNSLSYLLRTDKRFENQSVICYFFHKVQKNFHKGTKKSPNMQNQKGSSR